MPGISLNQTSTDSEGLLVVPAPDSPQPTSRASATFSWELAEAVEAFTAKNGKRWTQIELRNPLNLKQFLSIWLEGDDTPAIRSVEARTLITLPVEGVRAGDKYGELTPKVSRAVVEAAFARAGGKA